MMEVPLQPIVDQYRIQLGEAVHQLICHQIAVEQLSEENSRLTTEVDNLRINRDQLNQEVSDLYSKIQDRDDLVSELEDNCRVWEIQVEQLHDELAALAALENG